MRELLKRFRTAGTCCAVFVFTGAVAISAYAQVPRPERVELDVTATFVYPTDIQRGDVFPVFAWINNHSNQAILAPFQQSIIVRSHLGTYYVSDTCRLHCVFARSRVIPPGGKVLMHMGDVDTNTQARNPGEFSFSDVLLGGFTVDQKIYVFDIEDTIPATIEPSISPGYPSLVERQPLQLVDDEKVVRDPNTGYEWLRFNNSVGISEEELYTRMQSGGDLHEFRIARRHQVQALMFNYMNAAGVASGPANLPDALLSAEASSAIKQFVELMQPTGDTTNKIFVSGVVNDTVPLMDNERQFATINIYADKSPSPHYFSSPHGLQTSVAGETALLDASGTTGVWLVRGAEVNRHQRTGAAAYADDYLFLPNVEIDGVNYRLEMYRKEGTVPSFVVIDIRAASEPDLAQPVAVFSTETGQLSVKNVEVMSDLPAGKYDLTLEWIPGTELPLVKLTHVSLSAGQR